MLFMVIKNNPKGDSKGFTLIELVLVIAILGILAFMAVPSYANYRKDTEAKICNFNCLQLEKMYEIDLGMQNIQHSEGVFQQFLAEYRGKICPKGNYISYANESIRCIVHSIDEGGNNGGDDVPYL